MTAKPTGARVAISNRQRRLKIDTRRLAEITEGALEFVHDRTTELGIVLVDDAAIARLNTQYHDTPGPTDVLSFDYGAGQGELIISVEHAITQAKRFHTTAARELALYVVHGILHLHGYDDRTPRECRRMRMAERKLMSQLGKNLELKSLAS